MTQGLNFYQWLICAFNRPFHKFKDPKKIAAFSLLEVALALVIMGIIATLTLPLLTSYQNYNRHKITQTNTTQLFDVLAAYVLKYGRLPGPSTPALKGTSIVYELDHLPVRIGIFPYKELGIPESVARDGYGNWYTYAVTSSLLKTKTDQEDLAHEIVAQESFLYHYCHQKKPDKTITLTSLKGDSVLNEPTAKNDFIAVLLISHGPHGSGAFHPTKNERLPVFNHNESELKNLNEDSAFFVRMDDDENSTFEHQVFWTTRNNLLAIYARCPCQRKQEKIQDDTRNVQPLF